VRLLLPTKKYQCFKNWIDWFDRLDRKKDHMQVRTTYNIFYFFSTFIYFHRCQSPPLLWHRWKLQEEEEVEFDKRIRKINRGIEKHGVLRRERWKNVRKNKWSLKKSKMEEYDKIEQLASFYDRGGWDGFGPL
jgi:hypothetical protein